MKAYAQPHAVRSASTNGVPRCAHTAWKTVLAEVNRLLDTKRSKIPAVAGRMHKTEETRRTLIGQESDGLIGEGSGLRDGPVDWDRNRADRRVSEGGLERGEATRPDPR